ncbi:hypothetical protein Tco_0820350 [Tanacetum coccineum]|uniref:Uncharacterized protein n=1 Tax=Tanacetum coccineum TaxID=301880 RepID=A0ABQ5A976_9ASTR
MISRTCPQGREHVKRDRKLDTNIVTVINTPYCLEEQIRCLDCINQDAVLSRRFDTSYPTGGYGVSVDLSEQDT